jgi:VanZ family protein
MPLHYIVLTGFYCFLIFVNSAASDPLPVGVDLPFGDKAAHAVVFGGLCGLVALGMQCKSRNGTSWILAIVPVLFATAYGLTDEIHQLYVPDRSFEWADLLADFLGAVAVQTVLTLHWRRTAMEDAGEASIML